MCGVVFAYRPGLKKEKWACLMQRCLTAMTHRGPDGKDHIVKFSWAMGHRRLSIIDPVGSHQPMSDMTGRYHISYNGELYNYRELYDRLRPHWQFQTKGDTEVVLAGLVCHGTAFLNLMEGMWSIVLWDQQAEKLLLVRDRMGQKPLYYHCDSKRLACASELRGLFPLSWFSWREDPNSTADYLRYGYYLPGTTAFLDVKEVLPGHWLSWSPGQKPMQQAYWRLPTVGFSGNSSEAASLLRQNMVQSVKHRLVADVEVGALLSGGIDSSLIVSIVRQRLNKAIKTFTMGFEDPSFDERRYARRIAVCCGTRHYEGCFELNHSDKLIDLVLLQMAQPFADSSLVPTAQVCRLAGQWVKVALSGDGGDELFSGYQRYLGRALLRWYTRVPKVLRNQFQRLIRGFPEPNAHHSASFLKKAHLFLDASQRMNDETPYVAPLTYRLEWLQRLVPDLCRLGHQPPCLPEEMNWDDLHRMMTADALVYLPQDILAKVDRASMAFSLEVRSPFLDRRVVELAFMMPRVWHRRGLIGKRMLRMTFGDLLPNWAWRRRKHGFGVPLHQWFRSGLDQKLEELVEKTQHPLSSRFVKNMIAAHRGKRHDHGQRLWQIYIYLLWLEQKPWQSF